MNIKPSTNTLKLGTMFELSPMDVYMACIMATDRPEYEAFLATHETECSLDVPSLKMRTSRYLDDHKGIRECCEYLRSGKIKATTRLIENAKPSKKGKSADYNNKDFILEEYWALYNSETDPTKNAMIMQKITDLQQMKKDENKDETELVHFYLPITCKRCSLYMNEKKKKENPNT